MAFGFDGVDDYVKVSRHEALDLGRSPGFTIEFWVKPDRVAESALITWHTGASGGERTRIWQSIGDTKICVWIPGIAGGGVDLNSQVNVMDALVWRHVAVTFDSVSARARLYIDGVLRQTVAVPVGFVPNTFDDLYFGNNGPIDRPFRGQLDEISFYKRALAPDEIAAVYHADAIGKCPLDDNAAPLVNAGPDVVGASQQPLQLDGSVSDDARPQGLQLVSEWQLLQGPGQASFFSPHTSTTQALFDTPGLHTVELAANDGLVAVKDQADVRIGNECSFKDPANLVAWWPANGNAREVINGLDAHLIADASFQPGKVGRAFYFGVGTTEADGAWMPSTSTLNLGQYPEFTIEFWVKPLVFRTAPSSSGTAPLSGRAHTHLAVRLGPQDLRHTAQHGRTRARAQLAGERHG